MPAIPTPSIAISRELGLILTASNLVFLVATNGVGNGQAMALKNALTAADFLLQNQGNVTQLYPILQSGQVPPRALLNAVQRDLLNAWQTRIQAETPQRPVGRSPSPTPEPDAGPSPGPAGGRQLIFGETGFGDEKTPEASPTGGTGGAAEHAAAPAPANQPQGAANPAPAPVPAAFGQPHGAATAPVPAAFGQPLGAANQPLGAATPAPANLAPITGDPHAADAAPAAHVSEVAAPSGSPLQPIVSGSTAYQSGVTAAAHRQPVMDVMSYPLTAPQPSMSSVDDFIAAPRADLSSQPYMVEIMMFYKELNIAGFNDSEIAQRLSSLGSGGGGGLSRFTR
jgi:hypothetical protein